MVRQALGDGSKRFVSMLLAGSGSANLRSQMAALLLNSAIISHAE